MKNIGFMGLGSMGAGMSLNLVKNCSQNILGFDPVKEAMENFAASGGVAAENAEEIYTSCDIIFICLPTDELVEKTVSDIVETAKAGTIICDMGSTSPKIVYDMYKAASARGLSLIDSPVSGGKAGADSGTLAIMCGGERTVFEQVLPYLKMMGSTVTFMGPAGCGSVAKVANNMMVGIHLAAIGEAFSFAKKAGLDPAVLFDAIKEGFAQSAAMDEKVPKIIQRDFKASARTEVHMKDIRHALQIAQEMGVEIPLSKIVMADMLWMQDKGLIQEDHCALVKYFEDKAGVEIR